MEQTLKERIIELRKQGLTYDEIAEQTGTYKSKIHRILTSVSSNHEQDEEHASEELEQENGTEWNNDSEEVEQEEEELEQEEHAPETLEQEDGTEWNKKEQSTEELEQEIETLWNRLERLEQKTNIIVENVEILEQQSIEEASKEKKEADLLRHRQKLEGIADEQMAKLCKEMEIMELRKKVNQLENKYNSTRAKYKAFSKEYEKAVDYYEEELDIAREGLEKLKKQANLGQQVFEGIKTAIPMLIQHKPVQQFLNGLSEQKETIETPIPKQPTHEEEEFTEEEWENMNFILDVKEGLKDKFQNVRVLLRLFIQEPEKIDEVLDFLTTSNE